MNATPTDDMTDRHRDRPEDRYAQLRLDDDEFVIYDREDHRAWVQSSVAVSLDEYR